MRCRQVEAQFALLTVAELGTFLSLQSIGSLLTRQTIRNDIWASGSIGR